LVTFEKKLQSVFQLTADLFFKANRCPGGGLSSKETANRLIISYILKKAPHLKFFKSL
jgi:hypothetical protein